MYSFLHITDTYGTFTGLGKFLSKRNEFQVPVPGKKNELVPRNSFRFQKRNLELQVPSSFCLEIWKKVSRFWMTHTAQKIASHNEQLFMLTVYRPKHYFKKFIAELIS